jgi:S-formylglutathione hydrolase FrmB
MSDELNNKIKSLVFLKSTGRRVILGVLLLSVSLFAHAGVKSDNGSGRVACDSLKSKILTGATVPYCALLPPSYDTVKDKRFPVLYFFHGLGGNEQALVQGGWNIIEDLEKRKKIGEFVIITPRAGNTFYINSKNGKVRYEDFFVDEFIPAMEKKFRISSHREGRAISGASMGGYGALRTAFKHPELFVAVSAHFPALIEQMPKGAELVAGSGRGSMGASFGTAFGTPLDPKFWDANTPFIFARKNDLEGLKIHFDCGDRDEFGFDVGTTALHKLLQSRKVPHEYGIYPGGHNGAFLADHLPESMEFHSKAFGLTK